MKRPIRSPLTDISKEAMIARALVQLDTLYKGLTEKAEEIHSYFEQVLVEVERIKSLPQGPQGPRGLQGPEGKEGRGRDGKNGKDGKDGITYDPAYIAELAAGLIAKPKDGASPAVDSIVAKVIEALELDGKIETLRAEIAGYRNQLAGKHYGQDTWARGGGTTVSAGANVTLTPLPDGTVQINASGGGSGTNVTTQYSLTAVQAGDDVTIDLSQLTNFATYQGLVQVQRNNLPQTETINFTQTPTQVTIFNANADEVFNIVYQYT